MSSQPKIGAQGAATPFERHAREVLGRVRDAFSAVIEALPSRVSRASQLGRVLDLDRKLAWKISKVITSHDPFALVDHLPGAAGVAIFLAAADRRGVPPAVVDAARQSYREFEQLIEVHAGDRASLAMMAQAFSRETSEQSELTHRKASFSGNSYTWGVQARTQLSVNIIAPSAEPEKVDIALISGLIDLRRLRPKVAWVVARMGFVSSEGKPQLPVPPDATIEERRAFADTFKIPMLAEFCSKPPPVLTAKVADNGLIEIELVEGPVGDTGSIDSVFSGEPFRAIGARHRKGKDSKAHLNAHVRTPSSMLIHDLYAHKDLFGPLQPEVSIYSEVHRDVRSAATRDDRYKLPVRLAVTPMGRGPTVARTADVPRYPQLLKHVCDMQRWNADDFDLYRLAMPFPIVPSAVVVSFDLPEAPGS